MAAHYCHGVDGAENSRGVCCPRGGSQCKAQADSTSRLPRHPLETLLLLVGRLLPVWVCTQQDVMDFDMREVLFLC